MDRRRFLVTAGTAATVGLGGCVSTLTGGSDDYDVGMTPNAFTPASVTVEVGDRLVWQNTGTRTHTVTAYENAIPDPATYFASGGYESEDAARSSWHEDLGGAITAGETYGHTFEVAGTFHYFCVPHEQGGMRGTVVVEE